MAHNNVFNEGFETAVTGYQETWTATNQGTGGSENAAQAVAAAGSPSGWLTQCLRLIFAAGTTRYSYYASTRAISYHAHDIVVGASSLGASQNATLCLAVDPTLANGLFATLIANDSGGNPFSQMLMYYDGTAHNVGTALAWPIGTRRRFEYFWDNTNNVCWARCNGIYQGTQQTLTGTAAALDFGAILFGTSAAAAAAATIYYDRIRIDTAEWCGYPDHPLVGTASGYVGHPGLLGSGTLLG